MPDEIKCDRCRNQGWVCENHDDVPWDDGDQKCCGGAGAPCPDCNPCGGPDDPPRMPVGTRTVYDKDGWRH